MGYSPLRFLVTFDVKKALLVDRGAEVSRIRDASSATVRVSDTACALRASEVYAPVTISGPVRACDTAVAMLLDMIEAIEDPVDMSTLGDIGDDAGPRPTGRGVVVRMLVDNNGAGGLIGRQGAQIASMRQDSGCDIRVSSPRDMPAGVQDRLVLVLGPKSGVGVAVGLIGRQLAVSDAKAASIGGSASSRGRSETGGASARARSASSGRGGARATGFPPPVTAPAAPEFLLFVPDEYCGGIIGRQGAAINDIRRQSGCRIDMKTKEPAPGIPGAQVRRMIISGTPERIQYVLSALNLNVQQQQARAGHPPVGLDASLGGGMSAMPTAMLPPSPTRREFGDDEQSRGWR